jgi:hypothetical protein
MMVQHKREMYRRKERQVKLKGVILGRESKKQYWRKKELIDDHPGVLCYLLILNFWSLSSKTTYP